jgi:hypothetical protein
MNNEKRSWRWGKMGAERRYKNCEFVDRSRPPRCVLVETLPVIVRRSRLYRGDGCCRREVHVASREARRKRQNHNQEQLAPTKSPTTIPARCSRNWHSLPRLRRVKRRTIVPVSHCTTGSPQSAKTPIPNRTAVPAVSGSDCTPGSTTHRYWSGKCVRYPSARW